MPVITGVNHYAAHAPQCVRCHSAVCWLLACCYLHIRFELFIEIPVLSPLITDISFSTSFEFLYSVFVLDFLYSLILWYRLVRWSCGLTVNRILCSVVLSYCLAVGRICRFVPFGSLVLFYLPLASC